MQSKEVILPKHSPVEFSWVHGDTLEHVVAVFMTISLCVLAWASNSLDFLLNYLMALLPLALLLFSRNTRILSKVSSLLSGLLVFVITAFFDFTMGFFVSCLCAGYINLKDVGMDQKLSLVTCMLMTGLLGCSLLAVANLSIWLLHPFDQLQLVVASVLLAPMALIGRFNWAKALRLKISAPENDRELNLNLPYKDLYHRYCLLTKRLFQHKNRLSSDFKNLIFLIKATEKLIQHGNQIYDLRLSHRRHQLKTKYEQLQADGFEKDSSSSRANHLTELQIQIKYVDETISFEKRLFDQIETNLLIFERIELSVLRSKSAQISLENLELSKMSLEIQKSLDKVQDNVEGLIDLTPYE